jgi:hypothetical protein
MRQFPPGPGRGGFHGPYQAFHYFNGGHNAGYWLGFALTILGFVILLAAGIILFVRIAKWADGVLGGRANTVTTDAERSVGELENSIRKGVERVRDDLHTTIAITVLGGVLLLVGFILLTVYA